jgi:Na+-driven multidrug efflux pump
MMGIAMGSSVLTARFWGAADLRALRRTVTIALRLTLLISAALTLVTGLLAREIMSLYISSARATRSSRAGRRRMLISIS